MNINSSFLKRGEVYYKEGRVVKVIAEEEGGDVFLYGIVRGNYSDFYSQEILLTKREILGECTCPVGFNCKHVVAVILRYLETVKARENQSEEELKEKSFKNLKEALIKLKKKSQKAQDFVLTYRFGKEIGTYVPYIALAIHKTKKAFMNESKGKQLNLDSLFEDFNRDYVQLEDIKVIKFLDGLPILPDGKLAILRGREGYLSLKNAASTGRLFWENSFTPVEKEIEKIKLELSWEKEKNLYRAKLNPDVQNLVLLPTYPLLAYDKEKNALLEIEILDEKTLKGILNLPPVELKKAITISSFLEEIGIKVKNRWTNLKEVSIPPVPVLKIYKDGVNNVVELFFEYLQEEISALSEEEFIFISKDSEILKVRRDKQKEQTFLKRLRPTNINRFLPLGSFKGWLELPDYIPGYVNILREFILHDVPQLQKEGWKIDIDKDVFEIEKGKVSYKFKKRKDGWFSLSFKLKLGDEKEIPLAPVLKALFIQYKDINNLPEVLLVEYEKGKFVLLEKKEIVPVINTITQLLNQPKEGEISISPYEAHLLEIETPEELTEIKRLLKDFRNIEPVTPPSKLRTKLRNYQIEGISWLNFLYKYKLGGILADDMGLGKTVQTIAHLLRLKEKGALKGTSLIVVPTSLLANWEKEIQKFAPDLSFKTIYGKNRKEQIESAFKEKTDIVITTYNLILRDKELYKNKEFFYIILDEAQKIKNHRTKTYQAIVSLNGKYRLALSGTPIENNLSELWAIFNFLMPGFLGNFSNFKKQFQTPIEKGDERIKELLNKRVRPFILRRKKTDVLKELPPKVEIVKFVRFSDKEAKLYESIRVLMEKEVRKAIENYGFKRSQIYILEALLKLRQICCHPSLLKLEEAKKVKESSKLQLLEELLEELRSEGRKVLVFSQFVSMLKIIEKEILIKKNFSYEMLTGETRNRQEVIERFKKGKDVFLISLKAGGIGLNLTEADTVILYEPWWNPAVEMQAIDRAYRIGQERKVFVYRLIVENTVEEKMLELQRKKVDLQSIYEKGIDIKALSQEEILSLFS